MRVFGLLLAVVLGFGLLTACSGSGDRDPGVIDNPPSRGQNQDRDSMTKEEFEAEAREQLEVIDRRLDEARSRLNRQTGNEREELERRIDDLEERRGEVAKKLDKLRSSSGDNWTEIRDDVDDELNELEGDLRTTINKL